MRVENSGICQAIYFLLSAIPEPTRAARAWPRQSAGCECFFWIHEGNMRAVSSIAASAMIAVLWWANGAAAAAVDDQPVVKKATKAKKDKAKPDKNQYWLLNPTPPDQMRSFNTDRPTKANVPYTIDAGHFEYETDLVNFTHQVSGSTHTDTLMVPNPTFKVGLTNNVDLEVNVPFAGVHTFGSGPSSTLWGIGDTFVRSKINLWGNDGGDTAAALIPYVKAATAPVGIGNGAVEGGLIGPLAVTLPNSFTLLLVPEVDALKNVADNGRHGNYVLDVNLSREVIKNVTAYVELWSDCSADPTQGATLMSFDAAVQWLFLPNAQVDFGANFGMTRATPAVQVYTGLSQRF
jgi:Putative MetA-pathway of phenol degradation